MRGIVSTQRPRQQSFKAMPLVWIALAALAYSMFIAFTTKPVADFLYHHVMRLDDSALNALEFAAYPLLFALGITLWRPRFYGLQLGTTLRCWKTVLFSLTAVGVVVGGYVLAGEGTPWDARGVVNFTVVPLYEELLFRGILFALIHAYASRHFGPATSVRIAIVSSAIGFGLSHASNGFYVGWSFALFQVTYATLFGLLAGYNRAHTGSVIAPVLLHALMNALPIVLPG